MSEEAVQASGQGRTERPPLDDLMLAMDVVDTLRRRERLVERELDELVVPARGSVTNGWAAMPMASACISSSS